MNSIETYEKNHLKELSEGKVFPKFNSGDTLKVHLKVKEGEKERIQVFEGICIAKKMQELIHHLPLEKYHMERALKEFYPCIRPR